MIRPDFRPLAVVPLGVALSGVFAAVVPGLVWPTASGAVMGLLSAGLIGWHAATALVPVRARARRRSA